MRSAVLFTGIGSIEVIDDRSSTIAMSYWLAWPSQLGWVVQFLTPAESVMPADLSRSYPTSA